MKNKLKINLLVTWGEHGVGILIGLFLMPFVLGVIGDEQYGLWLFISSIAGYSGLMDLGFGETICRYVAHHHAKNETEDINRVATVIGSVYLGMCTLLLGLCGVLAWQAPNLYDWAPASVTEIRWVIMILGLNVVLALLGSVFGGVLVGLQRFDLERSARMVSGMARLVLTVVLLTNEQSLLTLALVFLLTSVVENGGYIVLVYRQLPGLRIAPRYWSLTTLKNSIGFSFFSFLNGVASKLIHATDSIVIGIVFGSKFIVPYFVAHRMVTFIVEPLHLIGRIAMPRGAELNVAGRSERMHELLSKGIGLSFLLAGGFLIGAWFFGEQVIEAWVGRSFEESHSILCVLLIAQLVATPMFVFRGVLFGMGAVRVPSILYAIEAVLNLILTLILIEPLGLMGVAIGTAIPLFVVELFIMLPYAMKQVDMSWSFLLRRVILPQVPPLAALLAYSLLISSNWIIAPSWVPVVLVSVGGGAVLGAVWLLANEWLSSRRATA